MFLATSSNLRRKHVRQGPSSRLAWMIPGGDGDEPCAPPRRPTPGPGRRSAVALAGVAQLPLLSPWSRPAGGGRAHGQLRGGTAVRRFPALSRTCGARPGPQSARLSLQRLQEEQCKATKGPAGKVPREGDARGSQCGNEVLVFGLGSPERRWLPALRGTVVAVTVVVCGQSRKVEISFGKRTRARRGGGAAPACQAPVVSAVHAQLATGSGAGARHLRAVSADRLGRGSPARAAGPGPASYLL